LGLQQILSLSKPLGNISNIERQGKSAAVPKKTGGEEKLVGARGMTDFDQINSAERRKEGRNN